MIVQRQLMRQRTTYVSHCNSNAADSPLSIFAASGIFGFRLFVVGLWPILVALDSGKDAKPSKSHSKITFGEIRLLHFTELILYFRSLLQCSY